MSSPVVEPIADMLDRWWQARQVGDDTGSAIIIDLWRAEVIAAATPDEEQEPG